MGHDFEETSKHNIDKDKYNKNYNKIKWNTGKDKEVKDETDTRQTDRTPKSDNDNSD